MSVINPVRARRIKYELAKSIVRQVINTAAENLPAMNKSTTSIQRAWREHRKRRAQRQALMNQKVLEATTLIQSRARIYLVNRRMKLEEEQRRHLASTTISTGIRQYLSVLNAKQLRRQRAHELLCSNALIIQTQARVVLARRRVQFAKDTRDNFLKAEAVLCRFLRHAFTIQAEKRQRTREMSSVTIIQKYALGYMCRKLYTKLHQSILCIQKVLRAYLTRLAINRQKINELSDDQIVLQTEQHSPAKLMQDDFDDMEEPESCSIPAQAIEEMNEDTQSESLNVDVYARIIQRWYRRILFQRSVSILNAASLLVTRTIRAHNSVKRARLLLEVMRHEFIAARRIQSHARTILAKRQVSL